MNVHELTLQNYSAASGCPSACQPILYLGTAGSYGNEQINVVLGEGWQGLTVKAVFQPSGVPVVVPDGSADKPIEAYRGMTYYKDKYYLDPEDSNTYICTRDRDDAPGTGLALYYLPHELAGIYFQVTA